MHSLNRWKRTTRAAFAMALALAVAAAVFLAAPGGATSLLPRTVVELIELSEYIVAGDVLSVTDGFDAQGVPYTEITLAVSESLKGTVGNQYTFRQFGLLEPRDLPDGTTYLGVSPQGWPRFRVGESVLVFLYKQAEFTGLRTTVGLFQGKFTLGKDGYRNAVDNQDLFRQVQVEPGLLNPAEQKMLTLPRGAADAKAFRSFVRKTVQGSWIQKGRVSRVK